MNFVYMSRENLPCYYPFHVPIELHFPLPPSAKSPTQLLGLKKPESLP